MSDPDLPAINTAVELWFSGYEDYYAGIVTEVTPPDTFRVTLNDGTTWPVDRVTNIWRRADPALALPALKAAGITPDPPSIQPDPQPDIIPSPIPPTTQPPTTASPKTPPPSKDNDDTDASPINTAPDTPRSTRRKAGRAFRKSTAGGVKAADAVGEGTGSRTMSRRSARAEAIAADEAAAGKKVDVAVVTPVGTRTRAGGSGRVREEEGRRTRAGGGVKRRASGGGEEGDGGTGKRRRLAEGGVNGGVPERGVMTRARVEEEGVEKLSTKAVTAIAVDAALASAKAVLKPLNDRLLLLRQELESISTATKKAAAQLMEEPKPARRRGRPGGLSGGMPSVALEAFHLDLSEMVGGGEARIKAYSKLSDHEFAQLHLSIEQQGAALRELDRLLYAAQALGSKAASKGEGRGGRKTRSG